MMPIMLLLALSIIGNLALLSCVLWQRARLQQCACCYVRHDPNCGAGYCHHHCLLLCGPRCQPSDWFEMAARESVEHELRSLEAYAQSEKL